MIEKKCPILSIIRQDVNLACIQNQCGWFDGVMGQCIMITIARNINPFAHLVVRKTESKLGFEYYLRVCQKNNDWIWTGEKFEKRRGKWIRLNKVPGIRLEYSGQYIVLFPEAGNERGDG